MRKEWILTIVALVFGLSVFSQDPVHWTYSAKKIAGKEYEVHLTAKMENGWHIYAQKQPKDAIAVPTTFLFTKNPLVTLTGKPIEKGKKETYMDKVAGITQYYYADSVEFIQVFKLKAQVKTSLIGSVTFQACTNEMCLKEKTENFNIMFQ